MYEKAYEQLVKNGTPLEQADIQNRFEIRLKNERADNAVYDLVSNENPEQTAFGIINRYVRFVDKESGKSREEWPLNPMWETFIGKHRNTLKLTTAPEPYTLERTLNWFSHQLAPTAKMLMLNDFSVLVPQFRVIVVIGLYLGFKREFTKLIGFLVVAMLSVGLVFNAAGVKDVLLSLFNQILGA